MSNYPNSFDDDTSIPRVDDNIIDIGAEVINAERDAIFSLEAVIGLGADGTVGSVANRLDISINPDGTIKPSAITGLGLVTLPIYDSQIASAAQIKESKLQLDYSTSNLFNLITSAQNDINIALSFITDTGAKLEPHLAGNTYRHVLSHIDIAGNSSLFFRNRLGLLRDNTNLYTLLNDINIDLVSHEKSDATGIGTVPPTNYGHVASGIHINTATFSFVPQTATDLQQFAQFVDSASIFVLGTRIQTLYSNGISRSARSAALTNSREGQSVIPTTQVFTNLLFGNSINPVDSIDNGDDVIEFTPDSSLITNNSFDNKFSSVKVGDIVTVNYGAFSTPHIIKEKKLLIDGSNKKYLVRINGKNALDGYFTATIDKPLFNIDKYGVLALAQANTPTNDLPSLIIGHPRGAQVLGLGFDPSEIDNIHFNLHLVLYPTGNPQESIINLPPIDISGNGGTTPGKYTLDSVVEAANKSFRAKGFNYRFIAYSLDGEFGVMLADPYNNASFSIAAGVLGVSGQYDQTLSNTIFTNNVVGTPGFDSKDALGFGPGGSNVASPNFSFAFANTNIAQNPTRIFTPLTRKNYYVNGVEKDRFGIEPGQSIDGYGESFWSATIISKTTIPSVRVEVTYRINQDLSESGLEIGKTLVVQAPHIVDSGRFFIKNVQFTNCPGPTAFTDITVYDAIHSAGITPFISAGIGTQVSLYFSSDSVGFNIENLSDFATAGIPFKRHFEIYITEDGFTFSHERGRMNISGGTATIDGISLLGDAELINLELVKISPKLRGYSFPPLDKITLRITSYNTDTGIFSGFLCEFDGITTSHSGPVTVGKKGDVVRLYDESFNDYIDIVFDANSNISTDKNIDIQLFPTLSLDSEVMLIGTVQVNDSSKKLSQLKDVRQFGNVSEKELSTSALDFIAAPTRLLRENGIVRGFDTVSISSGTITLDGGVVIVNGKIIQLDNSVVNIPIVKETLVPHGGTSVFSTTKWFLCVNERGELEFVASTDYDTGTAPSDLLSLDHNRLFYVNNPNSVSTPPYIIRSGYLSDIVLNKKDIVPIAIVSGTVALVSGAYVVSSSSIKDIRRFIYNGYNGLAQPFTLGSNASFRDITALSNYLTELNSFKSFKTNLDNKISDIVLVKDTINMSGITFDTGNMVKFVGDGGRFTIGTASIMKNVHLDKLRIDTTVGTAITFEGVQNNMTQCYFTATTTNPINITTASSARFTDNIFTGITATYIDNTSALNVMVLGNVYTTSATLVTGNYLPASFALYNSGDGA